MPLNGTCQGSEWTNNVDAQNPADSLTDLDRREQSHLQASASNLGDTHCCKFRPRQIQHRRRTVVGASLVNAIGNSTCKNADGSSFWDTTAIFITWDDWGGWYDHEVPTILASPFGGYQLGFRVPMIVVPRLLQRVSSTTIGTISAALSGSSNKTSASPRVR